MQMRFNEILKILIMLLIAFLGISTRYLILAGHKSEWQQSMELVQSQPVPHPAHRMESIV